MRRKYLIALAMCMTMAVAGLTLTGCGSKSSSGTSDAAAQEDASGESFGVVQSVDVENRTITISTMKFGPGEDGERPEKPSGEKPEGAPEDFTGERPEMPKGEKPENMPEGFTGEKPDGAPEDFTGEKPENMPAMDETTTYTVAEKATITDMNGNNISLDSVSENAFISYTLNGDEIESITVTEGFSKK